MSDPHILTKYRVRISTQLHVTTVVEAANEEDAGELGWEAAHAYAETITGDSHVDAEASFDGIGSEDVTEL